MLSAVEVILVQWLYYIDFQNRSGTKAGYLTEPVLNCFYPGAIMSVSETPPLCMCICWTRCFLSCVLATQISYFGHVGT